MKNTIANLEDRCQQIADEKGGLLLFPDLGTATMVLLLMPDNTEKWFDLETGEEVIA